MCELIKHWKQWLVFGIQNAIFFLFFFTVLLIYSVLYFIYPALLYFPSYLISCLNRNTAGFF